MTKHTKYNENLHIDEPGCDENPLEHEPTYNPLQYCYPIKTILNDAECTKRGCARTQNNPTDTKFCATCTVEYELAIKFQLQTHHQTTPINFIDPKTNKPHTTPFFPQNTDITIEPDPTGPEPNLKDYQIGEPTYYLAPTILRCKHTETGQLLTREATTHLISPEILQQALLNYRDQIEQDPNAPAILYQLLTMWDPKNYTAADLSSGDNWDDEDLDDDDDEDYDDEDYDDED
ncbi:MAG: hypothetical protein JRD89_02160 [Deltaproteobacteria bacterium]|nr:hypothetical protein [Deltaproteobacteria bacterium]